MMRSQLFVKEVFAQLHPFLSQRNGLVELVDCRPDNRALGLFLRFLLIDLFNLCLLFSNLAHQKAALQRDHLEACPLGGMEIGKRIFPPSQRSAEARCFEPRLHQVTLQVTKFSLSHSRIEFDENLTGLDALSSGLSWLAWAIGTPVVMISGFTHPTNEFETPYRVINYHACNSCWNDVRVRFDHKDYLWCPRHKDAPRQFECTRLITVEQVKATIKRIPGFAIHGRSGHAVAAL
jgi:hypothetical protein